MAESKSKKAEGLTYKGHPLRRVDNLSERTTYLPTPLPAPFPAA